MDDAFNLFDVDNDGEIKKANFEEILGGIDIDDKHWQEILQACDENHDGKLNKQEFIKLMMHEFK